MKWFRPEIYPLAAAMAGVIGFATFSLGRTITFNPEVRVSKEDRAKGVLDNHAEGENYHNHRARRFLQGRTPEVMPNLNKYFNGGH